MAAIAVDIARNGRNSGFSRSDMQLGLGPVQRTLARNAARAATFYADSGAAAECVADERLSRPGP